MSPGDEKLVGDDRHDCRCVCGSLIARLVSNGVELKCRRCKRTMVVPLAARAGRLPEAPRPSRPGDRFQ